MHGRHAFIPASSEQGALGHNLDVGITFMKLFYCILCKNRADLNAISPRHAGKGIAHQRQASSAASGAIVQHRRAVCAKPYGAHLAKEPREVALCCDSTALDTWFVRRVSSGNDGTPRTFVKCASTSCFCPSAQQRRVCGVCPGPCHSFA